MAPTRRADVRSTWRRLAAYLFDLVYPPRCVVRGCGVSGAWLCGTCLARVAPVPAPRCARCCDSAVGAARCRGCQDWPPGFRRAVAGGLYESVLRDAIHALKYRGVAGVAAELGLLAAGAYGTPAGGVLVVPVPSRRRRVAGRGIDHARLLAEAVAEELDRAVLVDALVRRRATTPQVGLEPDARRRNVAGAIAATPVVAGRTILLVDDVMTTGATVASCARALLDAGAEAVDACTVARACGSGRLVRR